MDSDSSQDLVKKGSKKLKGDELLHLDVHHQAGLGFRGS